MIFDGFVVLILLWRNTLPYKGKLFFYSEKVYGEAVYKIEYFFFKL